MIDLTRTRAGFLEDIELPDPAPVLSRNITELGVAAGAGHVCIDDGTEGDLFPLLKLALAEWFAAVPRNALLRDLLLPLKSALGNARKHGNGNDPAKMISVELVLTRTGAFVAVTDEGNGFDVAETLRRFHEQRAYFVHQGAGFRILHGASSVVSYENGGRTMLLCFRPQTARHRVASAPVVETNPPVSEHRTGELHTLPKILDADWIRSCLLAEVREFGNRDMQLESCRVYGGGGSAGDRCGIRYLLRIRRRGGGPAENRTLTARWHATQAAATADFAAATTLLGAEISKSIRIPRPVVRLAGEPRLVLFDFDPCMSLREYVSTTRSRSALRHCTGGVARALARLHGSQIRFAGKLSEGKGLEEIIARAESTLRAAPSNSDFPQSFRWLVEWIQQQAAKRGPSAAAPTLGAFGWNRVYYGVDSRFYLYRLESCRQGDPGLDLGGFVADLLCFTLAHQDEELFRMCRDAFLANYNTKATHPMDVVELDFYTAVAFCERLCRAERHNPNPLLGAIAALLPRRSEAATWLG